MKKLAALVLSAALALPSLGAAQEVPLTFAEAQALCESVGELSSMHQDMRNEGYPITPLALSVADSNMSERVKGMLLVSLAIMYERPETPTAMTKRAVISMCMDQLTNTKD